MSAPPRRSRSAGGQLGEDQGRAWDGSRSSQSWIRSSPARGSGTSSDTPREIEGDCLDPEYVSPASAGAGEDSASGLVYLFLVVFLRLFGKRELAQLNPFDLVVLLSLSNTVQNAMIGDDNSVSGGVIGAFSLLDDQLAADSRSVPRAETEQVFFELPRDCSDPARRRRLGGHEEGGADRIGAAFSAAQAGLRRFEEVEKCVLEPNGNFYMEGIKSMSDDAQRAELMKAIEALTREVKKMRSELRPGLVNHLGSRRGCSALLVSSSARAAIFRGSCGSVPADAAAASHGLRRDTLPCRWNTSRPERTHRQSRSRRRNR